MSAPSPLRAILFLSFLLPLIGAASVGKKEADLTKKFGEPKSRAMENVMVRGKLLPSFPKLTYQQGDWEIIGVFVEDRCAKITYDKDGVWPEEEYARVLGENSQGGTWGDDPKGSKLRTVNRSWIRSDGATAVWRKNLGLTVITPEFRAAEAAVKDKARNNIKILPKEQ